MSMLTPPGMGGKYRITGNRYPRMRRPRSRRKIVLSAVGAMVAMGLTGWGATQLIDVFTGGDSSSTQAGGRPLCSPAAATADAKSDARKAQKATAKLPKPNQITVNVYNATTRTGLAQKTADELKKRGFKIGKVDNAPAELDKKVKATGLVIGSPSAYRSHALSVVGTHLGGAETRTDSRRTEDVDLVIGSGFTGLDSPKGVQVALAALASPSPKPSPSC